MLEGRDDTQLLECTPYLFAWLRSDKAVSPPLRWQPANLRALDGDARLEWPCKIPGHEHQGMFNMEEALRIAPLLQARFPLCRSLEITRD